MPIGIGNGPPDRGQPRHERIGKMRARMRDVDDQRTVAAVKSPQVHHASHRPTLTGANHARARIAADTIGELGGLRNIPSDDVGALRCFEPAAVGQPERARGVHRRARQRLLRRQPEQRARHVQHQQQRRRRRRPGVAIRRHGHGNALFPERGDRRQLRFAQCVKRPGQKHGDRRRARHRGHARRIGEFEMVRGERARAGGQRRTARVRQLVGVQFHRQAMLARRREHALRLRRREADRLAVRIDCIGGARLRDRGNHLATHIVDVIVAASGKLGRKGMRREQRRAHIDAELTAERARDLELLQFGHRLQSVARLDLDRRDALRCKRGQPGLALHGEVGSVRGAGRAHRRVDAAALSGDVGVARAVLPLFEFAGAISRVDEMRVTVDESRRQPSSAASQCPVSLDVARNIARAAHPRDGAAVHAHRAVPNRAVGRAAGTHRGHVCVHQQQVESCRRHRRGSMRASAAL